MARIECRSPGDAAAALDGPVPAWVAARAPLPSCGVERATRQDGPWNLPGRRCFIEAAEGGQPAEFVTTRVTVEGDPIQFVYRSLGPGRFEVIVDSTRDQFGSGRWEAYRCPELSIVATEAPVPDVGLGEACAAVPIP